MTKKGPHKNDPPHLVFTVGEVAYILRVDETTVRRWISRGQLKAYLLPHRSGKQAYRIPRSEIESFAPGLLAEYEQQQQD
jgi:excisionase family DNA binding protein